MGSIKDIVDEIILEGTALDSLFRNKEPFLMFKYAKQGLNKLKLTFAQGIKGMNVRVPVSCKVNFPSDYQSFVRAYILGCDGKTIELSRNMNVPSEIYHYLLNCDGNILSDDKGAELFDECIQCDKLSKINIDCSICCGTGRYIPAHFQELYDDMQKYKDSWIKIHDSAKTIEFSSDLEDAAVVIEFYSNNYNDISECQIYVPYEYEESLDYYIKYKLLENGIDTRNQSLDYYQKFKNKRNAILAKQNPLTLKALNSFYKN